MRRIRIARPQSRKRPAGSTELDLRTPAGRPLPY
jgi:hypothetical protein